MKSYSRYKSKITGYSDVSETVKIVEKIAASAVHTCKKDVARLKQYREHLQRVITRLSCCSSLSAAQAMPTRTGTGRSVLVIFTGEKGLVGGLWHKMAEEYTQQTSPGDSLVLVGTKGFSFVDTATMAVLESFPLLDDLTPDALHERLHDYLVTNFIAGTFTEISFLYPQSVSIGEQTPVRIPFLPFSIPKVYTGGESLSSQTVGLPIFDASANVVFKKLVELAVRAQLSHVLLETKLSELSARTVSMEHAAQKTNELVGLLSMEHTRQRRHDATQKQLESFTAQKMV